MNQERKFFVEIADDGQAYLCTPAASETLSDTETPMMRLHVSREVATGTDFFGPFTLAELATGERVVDVPRYREVPSKLEQEARALIVVAEQTSVPGLLSGMIKRLKAALV